MARFSKRKYANELVFVVLGFCCQVAAAECVYFNSAPFVIRESGQYCLSGNVSTSGTRASQAAITVTANDVELDLGGHSVSGSGTGIGVAAIQISSFSVKNGTIENYGVGISVMGMGPKPVAKDNSMKRLRLLGNRQAGIYMIGDGTLVENNVIENTGGSGSPVSRAISPGSAVGIFLEGRQARITGNVISGTYAIQNGRAYGMYLAWAPGAYVANNTITGRGESAGISHDIGAEPLLRGNNVTGVTRKISKHHSNKPRK